MELKEVYLSVLNGLVGKRHAPADLLAKEAMRIAKAAMKEWEGEQSSANQ